MKRIKLEKRQYKQIPLLFKILYSTRILNVSNIIKYQNFLNHLENIQFRFNFYNPLILILLLIVFFILLFKNIIKIFIDIKEEMFKTINFTIRVYEEKKDEKSCEKTK